MQGFPTLTGFYVTKIEFIGRSWDFLVIAQNIVPSDGLRLDAQVGESS